MSIAPHVNSEVRLVLSDLKPLATIEKVKDPIGYSIAVSLAGVGLLASRCQPTSDSPDGEIIITKISNRKLIHDYLYLLSNGIALYGIKEYHRRMGKFFGYSSEDIEEFIEAEIDCNCLKCKGK